MPDLTPLLVWLQSLGPTGYALSAILGAAVLYWRLKNKLPAVEAQKLDLDALVRSQGIKPAGPKATLADVPAWLQKELQFNVCDPVAAADHKRAIERAKELEDNKLVDVPAK
ncbi:hypothetical protein [Gemmata sp.]|uniref:hypothetical protein n=1 Tax=Gemmata sp. TaxID=1914242 RepID=UPI003F714BF5